MIQAENICHLTSKVFIGVLKCAPKSSNVARLSCRPSTYPFVGDDLVGFLLQLAETQSAGGVRTLQGLGLLTGCGWTAGGSRGGQIIEVQVLVTRQVFLLYGLVQDIRMVPNLNKNGRSVT